MSDLGSKQTDKQIAKLDKQIKDVYSQAQKDLQGKLDDFNKKFKAKDAIHQQELKDGKITAQDYKNWVQGQVFQGEQWANKLDQVIDVIHNSNNVATNMINKGASQIFAFNGNYSAYQMESSTGVNFGFGLYDETTVSNLIKKNPQILPKWKIDEKKDYIWNKKKVNNAITQGVIQGERLDQITKRLSEGLCAQNENKMKTFARTGMTQAQNAGRLQRQYEAKEKGIQVVKMWMATLDNHTRDSHAMMDGEVQVVKDIWHPVEFSNGCQYPGDPEGPPEEVYNCRCTLTSDVEDYPAEYERYDNIDGKPIKNMTYQEWAKAKENTGNTGNKPIDNEAPTSYNGGMEEPSTNPKDYVKQPSDWNVQENANMMITDEADQYIYNYYVQTSNSWEINKALRTGNMSKLDPDDIRTIDLLQQTIESNHLSENTQFIRMVDYKYIKSVFGLDENSFDNLVKNFDSQKDWLHADSGFVGMVIKEKGFMSVSTDVDNNVFTSRPLQMEILGPKGKNIYVTNNYDESECVFGKGTEYKIVGFRKQKGAFEWSKDQLIMTVMIQ